MNLKTIFKYIIKIIIFCIVVFIIVLIIKSLKPQQPNTIPQNAITMEFPLKNGRYLINFNGPSQSIFSEPIHQSQAEKYALDITKDTNIKDLISVILTHKFKNNSTFGTPIYSPCVGNIKEAKNDQVDLPIGTRDKKNASGNHVVLGCYQFDVVLAHMKQGSVAVKTGQMVKIGDLLGEIGNSGNTGAPHLHIAATKTYDKDKIMPLPIVFNGRYLLSGDVIDN
ncbi:MAG: M23 family metallopeptidase [Patescibacteria group bacterium]|jgi:hypothetical protein